MFATNLVKAARSSSLSSQGLLSYTSSLIFSLQNKLLSFCFLLLQDLDVCMDFVDSGVRIVKMLLR